MAYRRGSGIRRTSFIGEPSTWSKELMLQLLAKAGSASSEQSRSILDHTPDIIRSVTEQATCVCLGHPPALSSRYQRFTSRADSRS